MLSILIAALPSLQYPSRGSCRSYPHTLMLDSNVSAERAGRVVSPHACQSRAGDDLAGRENADKHDMSDHYDGQGVKERGGRGGCVEDSEVESETVSRRHSACVQ